MESTIEIRPLVENDDMDDLIKLSKDFFKEYESNHEFFFNIEQLNDKDIIGYFSNWFNQEDKVAYIAIDDQKIIGYITAYIMNQPDFWEIKRVGHVSGLMVDSSMRRKGIAKELMLSAVSFFKARDVKYYTLFTSSNNSKAIKFYESFGMNPLYTHYLGSIQ
ncbi:GNAT family N-acetyltransferase [Paenibacillus sp. M1]|uniref:GNAT family N-acetyltransferase n=1 Tax=Paenibacillus haidiansis TaxID=1574488 RepID=A0ABU7VNN8_9BACL